MNPAEAKVLQTAPLATPTDLKPNAVRDLAGALQYFACGYVRVVPENKKLPLACLGSAFPRLSLAARRAGPTDLRDHGRYGRACAKNWRYDGAFNRPR